MANRPAPVERPVAARGVQLLINSGALLISAAWSFIIAGVQASPRANQASAAAVVGYALVAFFLFLLGVSMVMLRLVADKFPGAARTGVAIASALNRYLFGGVGN